MLGIHPAAPSAPQTVTNTTDYVVSGPGWTPLAGAVVVFSSSSPIVNVTAKVNHGAQAIGDTGYLDVAIDGIVQGVDGNGLAQRGPEVASGRGVIEFSLNKLVAGGHHTYQLMARVSAGTSQFGLTPYGGGHTEITVSEVAAPPGGVYGMPSAKAISYDDLIRGTQGLINFWPFLEKSQTGSRIDAVSGLPLAPTASAFLNRVLGLLPGLDSAVDIGTGALLAGSNFTWPSTLSMECILKLTSGSYTNGGVMGAWAGSVGSMFILFSGANQLRLYTGGSSLVGPTLVNGTAYHIVGTFDGTDRRIYLDGVLNAGPTAGAAPGASPGVPFEVSGYSNHSGGSDIVARVAKPAVYNRALTAAEVLLHYQAAALGIF